MNDWTSLDRFLRPDPRDVGCAQALKMLHAYVDMVAAGAPAAERFPASQRTYIPAVRAATISRGCRPSWTPASTPSASIDPMTGRLSGRIPLDLRLLLV
jgi:hypothetical protein